MGGARHPSRAASRGAQEVLPSGPGAPDVSPFCDEKAPKTSQENFAAKIGF